ncbi:uncharacterized protein [Pyrus communis]|uniref:uncharacterized protein n=1 Tax=Pyrus communis TaxID=23211 RepID=UPI0035BFFFC8
MEPDLPSRSNRKRPIPELSDSDSDSDRPRAERKVKFPKGKKAKREDEPVKIRRADEDDDEIGGEFPDPRFAAKEREKRRRFGDDGIGDDVSAAEVAYGEELDYDNFVDDGIQMDPFNLEKERKEGYFDAEGNFVEYAEGNRVKDAWLDSVEAGVTKLHVPKPKAKDDAADLPPEDEDIGKIKRRIADVLEEGETVLQALRRLKGNKKVKMSPETKRVFEQLTEDAVTLMDKHGEYDVNHEKKEIFEREAQGYETLARARLEGIPAAPVGNDNNGGESAGDGYDMFGEDDDEEDANAATRPSDSNGAGGGSSEGQNDYVFDENSGYYYSSSLGYYYDPSTGLFCSAASGVWYSYNEETGAYDEVPHHDQAASAAAATTTGVN